VTGPVSWHAVNGYQTHTPCGFAETPLILVETARSVLVHHLCLEIDYCVHYLMLNPLSEVEAR